MMKRTDEHETSEANQVQEKALLGDPHDSDRHQTSEENGYFIQTCHTAPSGLKQQVTELDWLDLPDDLLHHIADKLVSLRDYIRFGAACKLWQSAYLKGIPNHLLRHQKQFPFLLLPTDLDRDGQTRTLYNILEQKPCNSLVQLPHKKFCVGSRHGWLLVVSDSYNVCLNNPFLSPPANEICLPSLKVIQHQFDDCILPMFVLESVSLSHNPTMNQTSFHAMVIYGPSRHVAFCKSGDEDWTLLDSNQQHTTDSILYYRDQFYLLTYFGSLFICDLNSQLHAPVLSEIISQDKQLGKRSGTDTMYLVEICGLLYIILRYRGRKGVDREQFGTLKFVVFRVCLGNKLELTRVTSIGRHAVFVGLNSAFSVPASEFPRCRPNCIYFTDDYIDRYHNMVIDGTGEGPQDFGVFNLEDGTFEQYYHMKSNMIFPPPVWVEPTLRHCSLIDE